MAYLLSYTRLPVDSVIYDPRLAYSMHLAISEYGENYQVLNQNSGVMLVKATENEDGSLTPWSLKNPVILELKDGGFGVVAERIGADGEEDTESAGKFLYFTTKDFLDYTEVGFLSKEEAEEKKREGNADRMKVPAAEKLEIQGVVPQNVLEISESVADRLRKKLLTPVNCGMEFPEQVEASSAEELEKYRAMAFYTDGTKVAKRVDWDLSTVDFAVPGTYKIKGNVHQEHFEFPIAFYRADPCVAKWKN